VTAARRLATIPIIGAALGLLAFGIVRGAMPSGPARGVRLIVMIDPPLDARAVAMAEHVAKERITEKGAETRVIASGDRLVIEVGEDDAEIVGDMARILERTAKLELRRSDGPEVMLDGRAIVHAEVVRAGVAIDVANEAALAHAKLDVPIAFVLEDKVKLTAMVTRMGPTRLYVATGPTGEDATYGAALDLVAVIEAGAVHPMHVTRRDAFVRATGFWPRAWPFLALGAVLIAIAALVWRRAPRA
jgi:hypothetical protein